MHGFIVLSSTHIQGWDTQFLRIVFGYQCGVHASTRYSPYMVLIGRNPKLIVDNNLNGLCDVVDEHVGSKEMAKYMIQKM